MIIYQQHYKVSIYRNYITSNYFGRKWYLICFVNNSKSFYLSHYASIRFKIIDEKLMLSDAL